MLSSVKGGLQRKARDQKAAFKKATYYDLTCKEHTCTGTKEKSHQESVQVILAKLVYVRSRGPTGPPSFPKCSVDQTIYLIRFEAKDELDNEKK